MARAEIQERVRSFIVENLLLGEEEDGFSNSQSFLDSGLIDSTGILEIIGFLEEQFEITIEDDEMVPGNLDSVERIVAFLRTREIE